MSIDTQIRWLIRCDMPQVMQIERESFPTPWDERDFIDCLTKRNCIGMVSEANHQIVGYMVYELQPTKLTVLNFAVASEFRRQGVGGAMVDRLIAKLSQQRRHSIIAVVGDWNLGAQLFLRSQAFRCIDVVRDGFDDGDAYVFRYTLADHSSEVTEKDACQEGRGK